MNTVLPLNGTTAWATGNHEQTDTTDTLHPRAPGAKVGIAALAILTFVGLLMIGIFAKLLLEGDRTASKLAYSTTDEGG